MVMGQTSSAFTDAQLRDRFELARIRRLVELHDELQRLRAERLDGLALIDNAIRIIEEGEHAGAFAEEDFDFPLHERWAYAGQPAPHDPNPAVLKKAAVWDSTSRQDSMPEFDAAAEGQVHVVSGKHPTWYAWLTDRRPWHVFSSRPGLAPFTTLWYSKDFDPKNGTWAHLEPSRESPDAVTLKTNAAGDHEILSLGLLADALRKTLADYPAELAHALEVLNLVTNSAVTTTVKDELTDEAPRSLTWPPAVEELEDDAYTELVERVMDEASTSDFDHLSPEDLVDDILDNVPRAFLDAALEEVWRAEPSARERVLESYEKDTIGGRLVLRGCLRNYLSRYAQLIRAFPDSDEREKDGRLVRRRATRDAYSIFSLARKWGAERGDPEPRTIGDYIAALLRDDQRTWYFGADARIPALRDEEDCWVLANVLGRYAAAGRTGSDNPQP